MAYFKKEPTWSTVEEAMEYVLWARRGLAGLTGERDELRARLTENAAEIEEVKAVLAGAREFVKVTI